MFPSHDPHFIRAPFALNPPFKLANAAESSKARSAPPDRDWETRSMVRSRSIWR